MTEKKHCKECSEEIKGRSDKIFCSAYCKSAYHYKLGQDRADSFYKKVDRQLKLNRRILKQYNKAGLAYVSKNTILEDGFNPKVFTHYWKNQKGEVYLFCYEYGFLEKRANEKVKYVLVKWQDYMDNNLNLSNAS